MPGQGAAPASSEPAAAAVDDASMPGAEKTTAELKETIAQGDSAENAEGKRPAPKANAEDSSNLDSISMIRNPVGASHIFWKPSNYY